MKLDLSLLAVSFTSEVPAKKIMIEGCKTSNGSEFKKVGESKGTSLIKYLELSGKTGGF